MGAPTSSGAAGAPQSTPEPGRKRKAAPSETPAGYEAADGTPSSSKKQKKTKVENPTGEKRLRRFRPKPPNSFRDVYDRATSQRFFVLSRTPGGTADCPEELVELTGSTGNIYEVTIAQQPSCTCPHARAGNQCKHILYVLARVLRARFDLVYQLALLPSELREIFEKAPRVDGAAGGEHDGNRKLIEGDCPICYMEFEASGPGGGEAIVFCKAACGQNIHKSCFDTWAATKRVGGSKVTCPMCRSQWVGDPDVVGNIDKTGRPNEDGYVNVANQLGISTVRDTSTYSEWWSGNNTRFYRY